ncbi:MAG TPA: sporangiospore maturation cell wall hydrolase GsmA [Micromonosporaceae bacterium]|nr:sporangiospore maturation cell wall hydrolase GsmA [Micromonosporaceae bacterium]
MPLAPIRPARRALALVAGPVAALIVTLGAMPSASAEPVGTMAKAEFIAASAEPARATQRDYGVPASVTIAQGILESGWGKSGLAVKNKNFFGIKCFNGATGPVAIGCQSWNTSECLPTCAPTTATFRVYASALDSFRDHAIFLTTNKRYRPAFAHTTDANAFLSEIWKAGYATDPSYVENVRGVMEKYDLYRYDAAGPVGKAASMDGDGRAEIVHVDPNGTVRAFRNVNGLTGFPFPDRAVEIGSGFQPARTLFADLDGDGRTEVLHLADDGTLRAFRNVAGMAAFPYTAAPVVVGTSFVAGRTYVADLDGDGRAELISTDAAGTVRAFRNINGLGGSPYAAQPVVVGYGFDAARMGFADLNGDGRHEITLTDAAGTVRAFRNVNGLSRIAYPESPMVVGTGFGGRPWFADIDGDGRDEIGYIDAAGAVVAFRNVNGMFSFPYTAGATTIGSGFGRARTLFAQ